jgi:hypothetical protein
LVVLFMTGQTITRDRTLFANNIPNDKVIDRIKYLSKNNLPVGDKLKVLVSEIEIPNMDNETKNKLFDELFDVIVNMIDDGNETDFYFIHD